MNNLESIFKANRESWNVRTGVHMASPFYDVDGWKRGNTSLNAIELGEVGPVHGKKLLHLQCHFGLDTLSWARQGACVTGCDLSDQAVACAQSLAREQNLAARFICCNVYELPSHLHGRFDVVFTSYGTIGWLPDLARWAAVVAHFLKRGGGFYMVDFHPIIWMFDDQFEHIQYPYHNTGPIKCVSQGTYADRSVPVETHDFGWNHGLSEILNSLLQAGLRLQFLNEYGYSPYDCLANMVKGEDGNYRIRGLEEKFPLLYSLKAIKL
jgi:2-polyprenyl-3-methyl-5-hydroxy-6-metoxy-1,4-benzoquinol methylase